MHFKVPQGKPSIHPKRVNYFVENEQRLPLKVAKPDKTNSESYCRL